jgi:hypothetical protein
MLEVKDLRLMVSFGFTHFWVRSLTTPDFLREFTFCLFEIYPGKPSVKNYQGGYKANYFFKQIGFDFGIRAMYSYKLRQAIFIRVSMSHD